MHSEVLTQNPLKVWNVFFPIFFTPEITSTPETRGIMTIYPIYRCYIVSRNKLSQRIGDWQSPRNSCKLLEPLTCYPLKVWYMFSSTPTLVLSLRTMAPLHHKDEMCVRDGGTCTNSGEYGTFWYKLSIPQGQNICKTNKSILKPCLWTMKA